MPANWSFYVLLAGNPNMKAVEETALEVIRERFPEMGETNVIVGTQKTHRTLWVSGKTEEVDLLRVQGLILLACAVVVTLLRNAGYDVREASLGSGLMLVAHEAGLLVLK